MVCSLVGRLPALQGSCGFDRSCVCCYASAVMEGPECVNSLGARGRPMRLLSMSRCWKTGFHRNQNVEEHGTHL